MTTKIGLISDTHSTVAPLREALNIFSRHHVDHIICAGDIAGYGDDELSETVALLQDANCLMIAGNHDQLDELGEQPDELIQFFTQLPLKLELEIESRRLYVVHAEPPLEQHGGIKILDPDGNPYPDRVDYWSSTLAHYEYDILIVGHTHQVFAQQIGNTFVINPGSTCYNHTCIILDLPSCKVEIFPLSGKQPILTWNWGRFYQEQQSHNHRD